MQTASEYDGQIAYDLEEFCKDYGHPSGQLFTFEVTCNAVTYVYANVAGTVHASKVVFDLNGDDLVDTRKAH
jgi:hypothetical protein